MSIGGKAEKSKTNSQFANTTTDTLDPQLKAMLYGNVDSLKSMTPYQPYTGEMTAGFNADQTAAQDRARAASTANIGGGVLDQAKTAAGSAAAYQPQTVTGGSYTAATGPAVTMDRGAVRDVGYADTDADSISRFMNPYESEVVGRSTADLEAARQREQLQNQAFATKSGTLRGSGLYNMRDNTSEQYAKQIGDTSASLRYQGFNTAISAAQADAARKASADGANQGADYNVASTNAGFSQQDKLAGNAAKDAASQFGLNQDMQAQLANQDAAQGKAGLDLQSANILGGLSDQERSNALSDIGLQAGVGDAQQGNRQAQLDALLNQYQLGESGKTDMAQLINQALGLIPQTGSRTASGTEAGKASGVAVSGEGSFK